MSSNPSTASAKAEFEDETSARRLPEWEESERIAALIGYGVLDTPRERDFDDLVQIAAQVCGAPISVINLIADTRQWFKAEVGLGLRETPLDVSICARIIMQPGLTVVPDLQRDHRFDCNPLVVDEPKLRFYAGALLETAEGLPLGTLCVLDHKVRPEGLTEEQAFTLRALARQVMAQLELRRALHRERHAERLARQNEARQRQIINSATDYAIIATDLDGLVTSWSKGAHRVLGWTEKEMLGKPVDVFFTPEDVVARQPDKEMQAAQQKGCAVDERWHMRKSGERFWANGELTPLKDDADEIIGFVKVMRDRTDQRRVEDTLRQYAVLVENMTEGVSVSDENGTIVYTNPAEDEMFGYKPGELVGRHVTVQNAYDPDENKRRVEAVIAELKERGSWSGEWRNRRKDGTELITASRITAIEIDDRSHWLCVQRDITEAKRAEEHQKLLINESNHRVKNTLTTVQSIASQTLRGVPENGETLESFEGRIFALAKAHDVLTREGWNGAELHEVVVEVMEPYTRLGAERVTISGPALRLQPSTALAIAMAVHELATNAAKYGALSVTTGRVEITWATNNSHVVLRWQERKGPEVLAPTRKGFGTRLIERSLAQTLNAEVRINFESAGVCCTIRAPIDEMQASLSQFV